MGVKRKKSTSPPYLIWLFLVLVAIGALGIWLIFPKAPPPTFRDIGALLPDTTEVVITIDTRPQSWSFLDKSISPKAREIVRLAVEQSPFFSLLRQAQMDWQRDVQPWSGGIVGVALLGNSNDDSKATVLIAPSKNGGGKDFLRRYRRALGDNFQEQTYEGITYFQRQTDGSYVTAAIKNNMIIASNPQALFQMIDVWQNRRSSILTTSVWQQDTKDGGLVHSFVRANQNLFDQKIKEPEALTFTLAALPEGLEIKTTTHFKQSLPPIPDRKSTLVSLLPADTFFCLSGWQLAQTWSFLGKSLNDQNVLQQIESYMKDNTPFNLQEDILKALTGEFTIGAIPAQGGILGKTLGFGLVFLAEADQNRSTQFFDRLDELAVNSQGGILPRGVTLQTEGGKTQWLVGKSIAASHGFKDGVAYWGMGELGNRLNSGSKLPDHSKFQALTQGMKTENGGYFYLDMTVARNLWQERIAPPDWRTEGWFQNTMTILQSIEGVAFTQSRTNARTTTLEGKIILGKSS
jgi:hypothetical protein